MNLLEHIDFWKLLAGLGIFLFGIFLLEESIKQVSGKAFKKLIRKMTTGKFKSILTGVFSTSILQSSSAVSLMTITFVGAGIMSLENAIGVIMGTNIGTTFTGWIVAVFGFEFKIEGLTLPLIGIGGLGLIFLSKSPRFSGISKLFVGLGFLFMGIDYMQVSVDDFARSIDLSALPHYGTWFYVVIGFVLTAMMQSSSATIAIILTVLNSGIISFDEAAAMTIGANMGTTITILLGSIGAVQIKKQVAFSHVVFNLLTGLVALLILPLLIDVIHFFQPKQSTQVIEIAIFHTVFNILGVIIFFPFIPLLTRLLRRFLPDKEEGYLMHINNVTPDLAEATIYALYNECVNLFKELLALTRALTYYNKYSNKKVKLVKDIDEQVNKIYQIQKAISIFAASIRHSELDPSGKKKIHNLIHISFGISHISKTIWSIRNEIDELMSSSTKEVREILDRIMTENSEVLNFVEKSLDNKNLFDISTFSEEQIRVYKKESDTFISEITQNIEQRKIKDKHAPLLLIVQQTLAQINKSMLEQLMKLSEIYSDED